GEARDAATRDDVTAVLDRSVAERLRALDPDVVVTQVRTTPSLVADPAGWHLPGWLAWPPLAMMLLTVCSVIGSPLPWRATRWAWFWLVAASPIGLVAYLLLAGPLPLLRERFAVRPGFTGGWGLILGMGLAALVGW
ncbi:MAG: hypothetical protein REI11_22075, partial [Patulibacter sp.]|nr:hypothetical protein [Patulibacter sp.]